MTSAPSRNAASARMLQLDDPSTWRPPVIRQPGLLIAPVLLAVLLVVVFAGTAREVRAADRFRVGSKNFTEQLILGEIFAEALDGAGIKVERKLNLGGSLVA